MDQLLEKTESFKDLDLEQFGWASPSANNGINEFRRIPTDLSNSLQSSSPALDSFTDSLICHTIFFLLLGFSIALALYEMIPSRFYSFSFSNISLSNLFSVKAFSPNTLRLSK